MANFEPWSRSAQSSASEDARWSRLFGAVAEPEPLPELVRERVRRRLRDRGRRGAGLVLLRLVAVGVVLGVAGAAAAQWTAERWLSRGPREVPASVPTTSIALAPQPVLPRRARVRSEAPAPEPTVVEAAPLPPVSAPPSALSPSVPSSRLGLEASSLERAVSALRGGAPAIALAALNDHLRRFPGGALELEARVARVDALLLLARREEARRELSTLPLDRVGRRQELRLIRAELEADGNCGRALSDFLALDAESLPAAWAERALFGRGVCRRKLGDEAAASRDFAQYLERFPNGRFAAQLRLQRSQSRP